MRLAGISDAGPAKPPPTPGIATPLRPISLSETFFERPNQAWVGDIAYTPTREGWLCLGHRQGLMYPQNGGLCLFRPYRYCSDAGSHGHSGTPLQAV